MLFSYLRTLIFITSIATVTLACPKEQADLPKTPIILKHPADVYSLAFHPAGEVLVTGSGDGMVRLWTVDGKLQKTLPAHKDLVWGVAFHPNGKQLATGSKDSTIKLWSLPDAKLTATIKAAKLGVSSIEYTKSGELVAGWTDKMVRIYDVKGNEIKKMKHGSWITAVAVSPTGNIASVSASTGNQLKLWKQSGELVHTLQGHKDWLHGVSFNPSGKILATASFDHTIKLWDVNTGKLEKTLEGHNDRVYKVIFSSDDKYIISSAQDNTIKLWSRDGKLLKTFGDHTARVYSVALSPGDKRLASASHDQTVKLWWFKALLPQKPKK